MNHNQPAVFLDRDGVLIHEVNYLSDLKQIKIFQDVSEGLNKLKAAGFQLIMITNQSGVARGYFTEDFVLEVFEKINSLLEEDHVQLDKIYYCPHHISGQPPYNISCQCRKPAPGMIKKAQSENSIDLSRSFMIGDKVSDIELAINAQIQGILLTTGHGATEKAKIRQNYPEIPVFDSFARATAYILK